MNSRDKQFRFDDEEQVKFKSNQIMRSSDDLAELKSSDKKGADRLETAYKTSFQSSEQQFSQNTVEVRKHYIDPGDSMNKQISFNGQVAKFKLSHRKDTAAQTQESSTSMQIAKEDRHVSDTSWQAPSQDTQRRQDINNLCGDEYGPSQEQIEALINQNKALINQNQVMNNQVEDIKRQFMIFNTRGTKLKSPHFEDLDQLGIQENTDDKSLVFNDLEQPTNIDIEKQFLDRSNEFPLSQEPRLSDDPNQNNARSQTPLARYRSWLFRSRSFGKEFRLEPDIYSIYIISRNGELSFFFSVTIALSQFVLFVLMLVDILLVGDEKQNIWDIPPKISWQLVLTQPLALIFALITVDDVLVSVKMLVIGYDPQILIKNPEASYCKFLIANITRLCEGICTSFLSFLIIIQSTNAMQLIMDFVAVSFVSQIDNLAFKLARDGFLGERLKRKCEEVLAIKMKVRRNAFLGLINVILLLIFCPFLGSFVAVRIMQMNGHYLNNYACANLEVYFGEETLVFDDIVRFRFVGEGLNRTFANSVRTLPNLDEKPNKLLYQFFAGTYAAEKRSFDRLEEYYERPVYWETSKTTGEILNDPTSGKFYYCGHMRSWAFTIEALFDTPGAMAEEAREDCEWGWLMLSPKTDARILNDAPMEGWIVWTGSIEVSTPEFSVSCVDCRRNHDCGLTHGVCDLESRTCNCNDDWQGNRCQMKKPFCPGIVWVNEGESSRDYFELRPISNLYRDLYYDRPVYLYNNAQQNLTIRTEYAGRRWFVVPLENDATTSDLPHPYWDNILMRFTTRYSDPTTDNDPTGLTWNEVEFPRSRGNFGPFGASFPVKGRYECIQVDCMNDHDICGIYGTCVTRTEVVNGVIASYNQCECGNYTGGYFCEHHPDQPYSREMYNEYIVNPFSYRKYNPELEYLKFWLNETTEADVAVRDQEDDQDKTTQHDDREL